MATERDKLIVQNEIVTTGGDQAIKVLNSMEKSLQRVVGEMMKLQKATDSTLKSIGSNRKQFDNLLKQTSKGSLGTQVTNAQIDAEVKNAKASTRKVQNEIARVEQQSWNQREKAILQRQASFYQKQKKLELADNRFDLEAQVEGRRRRLVEARERATRNQSYIMKRSVEIEQQGYKRVQDELQRVMNLEKKRAAQTQANTSKLEQQAARFIKAQGKPSLASNASSITGSELTSTQQTPKRTKATPSSMSDRADNILADGGASLFRIQGQLLVNYGLMNQFFNLLSFGSRYVLELDNAMKNLQAVSAASNLEMEGLSSTIIDVSNNTKFLTTEVAEAATTLAQAGFSARQIENSIEGVTLLATATGSTLSTAVDVASSTISVFNLRAEDMNHVSHVLTQALNDTKLTMDKFALSIQYAGNIAAEAGLSFEETTAILGAMSNSGIRSGSTLGTGLRQVLTAMINPSEKFRVKLRQLGLTLGDVDVRSKGFVDVLETLQQAGFSTSDAFEVFEVRSAAAFAAIAKNPQIINQLRQNFALTTAATKANATQMESLTNIFVNLQSVMGNVIVTAFTPFVTLLKEMLQGITALLIELNKMPALLEVIAAVLTGLVSSFVILRGGKLLAGLLGMQAAMQGTAKAATGLASFFKLSPWMALAGGIAAVVYAITKMNGGIDTTKKNLDELEGRAKISQGNLEETDQTIMTARETRNRLLNRYDALRDDPQGLRTEMISLQAQFGTLGLEVKNKVTTSFEDLTEALDKLIIKLESKALEQSVQATKDITNFATAQAGSNTNNLLQGFRNTQDSPMAKYLKSDALKKLGFTQESLGQELFNEAEFINDQVGEVLKMISSGQSIGSEDGREKLRNRLIEAMSSLQSFQSNLTENIEHYSMQIESYDKEMQKDVIEETKIAKDSQEKLVENVKSQITTLGSLLTSVGNIEVQQLQNIERTFNTTSFARRIGQDIDEYRKQFRREQGRLTDATRSGNLDLQREIEQDIINLRTQVNDNLEIYIEDNTKFIIEEMETLLGRPLDSSTATPFIQGLKSSVNSLVSDMFQLLDSSTTMTLETLGSIFRASEAAVQQAQQRYQNVVRQFEIRSSGYEYVLREAEDSQRGGLRGRFSDAQLSIFRNQQRGVQVQSLEARRSALVGQSSALNSSLAAQQAIVNVQQQRAGLSPNDPKAQTDLIEANQKLLDIRNQLKNTEMDLLDITNEYNAVTGRTVIAEASRTEQLEETMRVYTEALAVESSWAMNMMTDITAVLDVSKNSMSNFFQEVVTGTQSVTDAFRGMVTGILQEMLKITTNRLAANILLMAGNAFTGWMGSGPSTDVGSGTGSLYNGGGFIKANDGAFIGRDHVPVLAQNGEFILRRSAVSAIGRDNLEQINALGSRNMASMNVDTTSLMNNSSQGQPSILNVYVVSPDQRPSLTKNDVLVTITDDINRNGPVKRLIKQVAFGG